MNKLRKYRLDKKLTQFQLAVKAGLSLAAVSLAERTGHYSQATAECLAQVLGISADCLRASELRPGRPAGSGRMRLRAL